jgi:hypothetical protein
MPIACGDNLAVVDLAKFLEMGIRNLSASYSRNAQDLTVGSFHSR